MSNSTRTCECVLDPDDPETWGGEAGDECHVAADVLNDDGVWTCPHDAEEGEDLCLFHLPIEEKVDDEVVDAFLAALEETATSDDGEARRLEFVGAKFGAFNLSELPIDLTIENSALVMDHVTVTGALDWSEVVLDVTKITFNGAEFEGTANFFRAEFGGRIHFGWTNFGDDVHFSWMELGGGALFGGVTFGAQADFRFADFGELANFGAVTFRQRANFEGTAFSGLAKFRQATFEGEAEFEDAAFRGKAEFRQATFEGKTEFKNAAFEGTADFREAAFEGDAPVFTGVEFEDGPIFEYLTLDRVQFDGGDLTDATFTGASLRNANFESTLLSRATLFEADLRGAKLSGAVLGDVRIDDETRFLGHPSADTGTSPHTISAIRSRPTCVYDPDYEDDNEHEDVDKAKSVYRALEELGGKHARPRLQARGFVRRQDLQKQGYWDGMTAGAASLEERFIAGARWSRAKVARTTLLYGESPWRVIAWSLGIIFSFALLYPLGGWIKPTGGDPITYAQIASNPAEILNSVYYSTLTYTAFGFVDFQPVGLGRLFTTVETGLGAVMLALLVFILGRRAAR